MTADHVRAHLLAEHQRRVSALAIAAELSALAGCGYRLELELVALVSAIAGIGAQRGAAS